jgi:sodium/proline symporter
MSSATIITFILYIIVMIGIGFYFYKRTASLSDYILGGRGLSPAVAALSAGASDMSGWLMLGLPGAIYMSGMNQIWIGIGLTLGAYLNWLFVAGRLRVFTARLDNAITIPDYLSSRFDDNSGVIRMVSALIILIFFTLYIASGLVAGAVLFENSFGMHYETALLTGSVVIVAYTFLGGFNAVSWTDFIQGILMLGALLCVPLVVVYQLGGWSSAMSVIENKHTWYLDPFHELSILSIISLLAWGLGYFGQPHILARFMSIKHISAVPVARRINIIWMVLALLGALLTGFMGIAYFATPLDNHETVFIVFTQTLFNPWVAGILLAAILSAIMSTIDSQILVCASTLTEDLYHSFLKKKACQHELVWVGRITVILVAVIAIFLAMNPERSILELVAYAWAGFGAAFGPVIVFSLFWKPMSKAAALGGMITGAVTVLIWKQLEGGVFDLYELLPGFVLASVAISLIGRLSKVPSALLDEFSRCEQAYLHRDNR